MSVACSCFVEGQSDFAQTLLLAAVCGTRCAGCLCIAVVGCAALTGTASDCYFFVQVYLRSGLDLVFTHCILKPLDPPGLYHTALLSPPPPLLLGQH